MATTLTQEQRQARHADLLNVTKDNVSGSYEDCKSEFVKAAAESGYDYACRWKLEPVLKAEYAVRAMEPALHMLGMLVAGEADVARTRELMTEYRDELMASLVRQKPWEHRCTGAMTNLAGLLQASVRAESVERVNRLLHHLER